MNTKSNLTIVWFRRDLRLQDHPALYTAVQRGRMIPLFIWSPDEDGPWNPGEASRWWLHHALASLAQSLEKLGSKLILRTGSSLEVLKELIEETGADALYFNERYEPFSIKIDQEIKRYFQAQVQIHPQVQVQSFHGNLLLPPHQILNKQNQPYKVFTPFWKQCLHEGIDPPYPAPTPISSYSSKNLTSLSLEELKLLPVNDWHIKLTAHWKPGEDQAHEQLKAFVDDHIEDYKIGRDIPYAPHVSKLSPYLAWGEISPKQIWHFLLEQAVTGISYSEGREAYLRQLVWKEFSTYLMVHAPETIDQPLRKEFKAFPWQMSESDLRLWQQGRTGYPLVDAGMRELWETGWMHNRVRLVVSSFLVKHLLISWKEGARWFWDTLLDADLANNTMGWQWIAGCGADASPYFRIFNPITQSEKFDPEGLYIRQWIPELKSLSNEHIHKPWTAPKSVLEKAGIDLGITYPYPMIDHPLARERALSAYHSLKRGV